MVAALLEAAPPEQQISEFLLHGFGGLSPLIARELAFRAGGAADVRLCMLGEDGRAALVSEIGRLNRDIKENNFTPMLLLRNGEEFDFSFQPILQYGPGVQMEKERSFSGLLERCYRERDRRDRMRHRGQDLHRAVKNACERTARRLNQQRLELEEAAKRESFRQQGDIIMANLYKLRKGMAVLRAQDFYDPEGKECAVALDPLLTPQQNAARYYKKYSKLKTADAVLRRETERANRASLSGERPCRAGDSEREADLREIRRSSCTAAISDRRGRRAGKSPRRSPRRWRLPPPRGFRFLSGETTRKTRS
jgi:predicted ribosome quality control (RQC) complex YloA/Tae2 family protein